MGFSISWIAVKDKTLDHVIEVLDLEKTGEIEEFPESEISGANLSNNWCHIQFNYFNNPLLKKDLLKKLSQDTTVIFCQVEEHVMYSKACCWENGSFHWAVEHDAQQDLRHIDELGNVPGNFEAIRKQLFEEQDQGDEDVDYIFDAPIELAASITTVRHDMDQADEPEYHVLTANESHQSQKNPWWKIW
ncbi:hypothetical protein ACXWTF_05075 [Thiomicrolovo sp. ZZH C-3]